MDSHILRERIESPKRATSLVKSAEPPSPAETLIDVENEAHGILDETEKETQTSDDDWVDVEDEALDFLDRLEMKLPGSLRFVPILTTMSSW
jgi:hypothetical protein